LPFIDGETLPDRSVADLGVEGINLAVRSLSTR
jgi:hypothetical protein